MTPFNKFFLSLTIALIGFLTLAQTNTIVFYNVENLFDTIDSPDTIDEEYLPNALKQWNSERYFEKLNHINKVFQTIGHPVLIGLCEIENAAVVEDIVLHGPMKTTHNVVHFESLDARGIDNALIYDRTILSLVDFGFIRFEMPANSSPSRDIVWAKFNQGKHSILAMVNHWPSRRGGEMLSEPKRLIASTYARAFIDSCQAADPNLKIIFMGDLNDHPDNMAPQMISSILNPMITSESGQYGGSYSYKGEWNVLDHIMVSANFLKKKGMYVKKNSGKIHSNEFLLETYKGNIVPFRTYGGNKYLGGYSDHLPVSVEIGL